MTASDLTKKHCRACEKGTPALSEQTVTDVLKGLQGWKSTGKEIYKKFDFKNYYETMAFVNAVAFVSHREDHHPDLEVGYNRCLIKYSTHTVGGLSENDLICAARVEAMMSA